MELSRLNHCVSVSEMLLSGNDTFNIALGLKLGVLSLLSETTMLLHFNLFHSLCAGSSLFGVFFGCHEYGECKW
jgi:hypothetical protein